MADKLINVVFPDGEAGAIPESALDEQAISEGFRPEKPQETAIRAKKIAAGEQPVRAFTEAVARGASFNTSDILQTELGLATPEELKLRQQANPVAAGLGEVTGVALPAFLPGGQFTAAGAAARLGSRIVGLVPKGAGLAAKLAASSAASGLEGGLWGLGKSITEAHLDDTELTAQKLFADVGLNALGGAAGGALVEGGLTGFGAAQKALVTGTEKTAKAVTGKDIRGVRDLVKEIGFDFDDPVRWVSKDIGLTQSQVTKIRQKPGNVLEEAMLSLVDDPRYAAGKTKEDLLELIKTKKSEGLEDQLTGLKEIDELTAGNPNYKPDFKKASEDVFNDVYVPLRDSGPMDRPIALRVKAEMKQLEKINATGSFEEAETYKRYLDSHINWGDQTAKPLNKALQKIRTIVKNEIDDKALEISKALGDTTAYDRWKAGKKLFGAMSEIEQPAEKRVIEASIGNREFGLTDNIWGAGALASTVLSGNIAAPLISLSAMLVNRWGRKNLPKIIALRARALQRTPGTKQAAKAFGLKIDEMLTPEMAQIAPKAAFYADNLKKIALRSPIAALSLHSLLSEDDPEYKSTMESTGLQYVSDPNDSERIKKLDAITAKANQFDRKMDKSIEQFVMGKTAAKKRAEIVEPTSDKTKGMAKQLAELRSNPIALNERITKAVASFAEGAPMMTGSVMATAKRAVDFLQSKAPKQTSAFNDIPALRRDWVPNGADVYRFEKYLSAVNSPQGAIDDIAHGIGSQETIEALKAVYPALYADMRAKALNRLAELGKTVDYRKRINIGLLLDAPADDSMRPEMIAQIQQGFSQPPEQGRQRKSLGPSMIAKSNMTDSERLLARRG